MLLQGSQELITQAGKKPTTSEIQKTQYFPDGILATRIYFNALCFYSTEYCGVWRYVVNEVLLLLH